MLLLNYASRKIIPENIAYRDISYSQLLKMSLIWEGSIISWVAFWAFYGQGFGAENLYYISILGGFPFTNYWGWWGFLGEGPSLN